MAASDLLSVRVQFKLRDRETTQSLQKLKTRELIVV